MSLHALHGTAKMHSVSPLLLQLKISGTRQGLTWIWVTATHDAYYSNTGTCRPGAAILWASKREFYATLEAFNGQSTIPIGLTYDDAAEVNNVRRFRYLNKQVEFSSVALDLRNHLSCD